MRTIVVGFDATEQAARALERAAEIAEAFGARLVVANVAGHADPGDQAAPSFEQPPIDRLRLSADVRPAAIRLSGPHPDPADEAERRLDAAREQLAGRRVEVELVPSLGELAEVLLELAEERCAELVVGAREHGLLGRLLGHSVSDRLARHARRDVLIVH